MFTEHAQCRQVICLSAGVTGLLVPAPCVPSSIGLAWACSHGNSGGDGGNKSFSSIFLFHVCWHPIGQSKSHGQAWGEELGALYNLP